MDEWDLIGRVGYLLGNILFSVLEGYGLTGRVWAFPFFQIRVLGLTSRASVWAAMEGYGRGTDHIALLGWRVEYLAHFFIPIRTHRNHVFRKIKPNPFLNIEKATLTFQNLNEFMIESCHPLYS